MASLPVLKRTLDVLVLRALLWATQHGFEITSWLEEHSANSLGAEDSAVYQALYRMEERGLIEAEWGVTEKQRQARYYRITAAGRAHLKTQTAQWVRYADTVTAILTAAPRSA